MENMSQGVPPAPSWDSSSKKWMYLSLAGVGMVAVLLLWVLYLGPDAQKTRELDRNYDIAINTITNFEEAMRNDTYGGETPEETLELFIHALNKGDVDLAWQYFTLQEDGPRDQIAGDYLYKLKEKNEIATLVKYLSVVKPDEESNMNSEEYKFVSVDGENDLNLEIYMILNKYSRVWKIKKLAI